MHVHWWPAGEEWGDGPLHAESGLTDGDGGLTIIVPDSLPDTVRLQVQQAYGPEKESRAPFTVEHAAPPIVVPPPSDIGWPTTFDKRLTGQTGRVTLTGGERVEISDSTIRDGWAALWGKGDRGEFWCGNTVFDGAGTAEWLMFEGELVVLESCAVKGFLKGLRNTDGARTGQVARNVHFADIREDLAYGNFEIYGCTGENIGMSGHPDVLQPRVPCAVDGLTVRGYQGVGISLGDSAASGSTFRNIEFSGMRGTYNGVQLGHPSNNNASPSDLVFENVRIPEAPFQIYPQWQGRNVRVRRDCVFSNGLPQHPSVELFD